MKTQLPNWLIEQLFEREKSGSGGSRRGPVHVGIFHDDRCDHLNGRGPCNCVPNLRRIIFISRKPEDD